MAKRKRATLEEYLGAVRAFQAEIATMLGRVKKEERMLFQQTTHGSGRPDEMAKHEHAVALLDQLQRSVFLHPIRIPDCFQAEMRSVPPPNAE